MRDARAPFPFASPSTTYTGTYFTPRVAAASDFTDSVPGHRDQGQIVSLTVHHVRPAQSSSRLAEPDGVRADTRTISPSEMTHDHASSLEPVPTGPGDSGAASRLPVEIQLDILDLVVGDLDALSLLWEVSSSTESSMAVRPLCVGNEEDHYAKTRARRLRNIFVLLPKAAPCIDQCFARVPALGGPGSHEPSAYWVDFQRDVFAPLARTKQNGWEIGRALARSTWAQAPGEANSFFADGRSCRGRELIQNILVPEDFLGNGLKGLETAKNLAGLRRIYVLQAFVARYPQGFAAGSFAQHVEAWARDARASAGAEGTVAVWPFSVVLEALAEVDPGAGQARTLWTTERPDAFWPYGPDWYHKRHGVAGRMKRIGEDWMRTQAPPRVEIVLVSPRRGGGLEPTFLDGRIFAPSRPQRGLKRNSHGSRDGQCNPGLFLFF